ncbi:MAG TPA: type II toxin-antitoxin system HicA family toxin [Oculatellaceae cyanobacterium]|jgi:predicted RNA binding protein YcfA (HicA-like mRNA interferase family)
MPRLKRLSGAEVIEILSSFGFQIHSQKGSHVKLKRSGVTGEETLTVPNHRELDTGTCRAIYRQATKYIPESELYSYFYQ